MSDIKMSDKEQKLLDRYGKSEQGNFYVFDTIGVPHTYCIGSKHITHAADYFSGMLSKEAIIDAEKKGAKCGMRGCQLSYEEHKQALLVKCEASMSDDDGKAVPELHAYLLKSKPLCEEDKYAGFGFIKAD